MSSLFLFGAGASAFCGDCVPRCPPVGNELFDALQAEGGVATTVDGDLASLFRGDFEEGMQEFRSRREVETSTFLRDMASYFARFEPGSANHYRTLVEGLASSRQVAVFATLNYDLILEQVISQMGWRITYLGNPPTQNFLVLKLHGSCNFLPALAPRQISGIGFDLSNSPQAGVLEAPVRVAHPREVLEFCRTEDSIAPSIALYAQGKQVLYCGRFVREIQEAWRGQVAKAHRIFVIGVRPNRADTHVWGALAKKGAPIWYVGPDRDAFREWSSQAKRRKAHHLADDFGTAVPQVLRMLSG